LFQAYLDRHLAQARLTLQSEWIANAQRIEVLAQKQQKLEVQAKAIASRSGDLSKSEANLKRRIAKAKANIRRIQDNERFAKWLDNACWTINRFGKGTAKGFGRWISWAIEEVNWQSGRFSVLIAVALVHWLVFFPLLGAWGLRIALSDRCLEIRLCQSALRWAIMSNAENHRSK
jgi:hypothetical protein